MQENPMFKKLLSVLQRQYWLWEELQMQILSEPWDAREKKENIQKDHHDTFLVDWRVGWEKSLISVLYIDEISIHK